MVGNFVQEVDEGIAATATVVEVHFADSGCVELGDQLAGKLM